MNHLIRKATLLAVGALLIAGAANAGAPSAANSTKPAGVTLACTANGVGGPGPDANDNDAQVQFVIRDGNGTGLPIPNATVTLGFAGCKNIWLSSSVKRTDATVDCIAHTVSTLTNTSGVATFAIAGQVASPSNAGGLIGADDPAPDPAPGTYFGCVTVTVTVPGFPPAIYPNILGTALDQNGISGVDGGDLSLMLSDRFIGNYRERNDHNLSSLTVTEPTVSGGDLSIALAYRFNGKSTISITDPCAP